MKVVYLIFTKMFQSISLLILSFLCCFSFVFSSLKDQEAQFEEQLKYGIRFDDDYNYMQHLKSVSELYDSEMVEVSKQRSTNTCSQ